MVRFDQKCFLDLIFGVRNIDVANLLLDYLTNLTKFSDLLQSKTSVFTFILEIFDDVKSLDSLVEKVKEYIDKISSLITEQRDIIGKVKTHIHKLDTKERVHFCETFRNP